MRWIATLWDVITFTLAFAAFSIGTIAIHAPDVLTAYPQSLPAMSESEAFATMDTTPFP